MMDKDNKNVTHVNFQYNKLKGLINEDSEQFERDLSDAINKAIENEVDHNLIVTILYMHLQQLVKPPVT